MAKPLFRKTALEKLASPEQLDYLMKVTSPKGWMALLVLAVLLISGILWGVYGAVPTTVTGNGILIKHGGLHSIVSTSSGQVMEIYIKIGETVRKGQMIARIDQHDLVGKIQNDLVGKIQKADTELKGLKSDYNRFIEYDAEEIRLQKKDMQKQRERLQHKINNDQEYLKILKERLINQEKLLEDGLITKQSVLKTRQEINETEQMIEMSRGKLEEIGTREFQIVADKERQHIRKKEDIEQVEQELALLEERLKTSSRIISPHTGRILEMLIEKGDLVREGDRLITLETEEKSDKDIEVLIYASPLDGKKVSPGMDIHISPSTVKQEEYGFMQGKVTYVAEFPTTKKEMMHILKNEELAADFVKEGDPIEIHADLIPDSGTVSGFKWSSPKGPPIKIHSGTLCFSKITLEEQPPISLVIPLLKRTLLGIGER